MYNRNYKRKYIQNNSILYNDLAKRKQLNSINHYATLNLSKLIELDSQNISSIYHAVEPFETLQDISQRYYESPEYAWLICFTNNIESELEINFSLNRHLQIFYPLQKVLDFLEG